MQTDTHKGWSMEAAEVIGGRHRSKKGNMTSVVWMWFGYARSETKQTVVLCKVFKKMVKMKGSSTTNLLQHIKQKLPAEWDQCVRCCLTSTGASIENKTPPKSQQSVAAVFSKATPNNKSGQRWKDITNAVALA